MSAEVIVAIAGVTIIAITFLVIIARRLPKRIKTAYYIKKWREIQKMCSVKDDWAHAIIHADMLLDEVMVRRRVGGRTMGERMVSVQKHFTANDAIWGAHKLAKSIRHDAPVKLTEAKVKDVLVAYRQALRDLKAL